MHVAYFSNQFADKHGHGLARYSRELFAALGKTGRNLTISPVAAWSSISQEGLRRLQRETNLKLVPTGRTMTPLLWTFLDVPTIESWLPQPIDLVHLVALGYPVATRKPLVVTVHDLGPLTHPEYFRNTRSWVMQRSLAQAVKQADAIICVSLSTASELVTYAGDHVSDRISVIPEGVSSVFFDIEEQKGCRMPENIETLRCSKVPFILSTGKISPRKNVQGILRAMSKLVDTIPHHLVLVGGEGWNMMEIFAELRNPKVAQRTHFAGYVTDEQLRALYARASVYVHPSLYEGFGLTVLESMAAGCPVITSNVYSLPEVAGDAAVLVDPEDSEALANAIETLCTNEHAVNNLRAKGRSRAEHFRWSRCAEQVYQVYATVSS